MFFAAVELKKGETAHDAVKAFAYAVNDNGGTYTKLKVFGITEIGTKKYVRFASDCGTYTQPIIKRLIGEGRCFVAPSKTGYLAFLTDGRTGRVSATQMQAVVAPGYGQVYRGPGAEFWERQFPEE